MIDTFPLTVKVAPQASVLMAEDSRITHPSSADVRRRSTNNPLVTRPLASLASIWTYLPLPSVLHLSILPWIFKRRRAYSPPFSTHAPSCTSPPFSKIVRISVTAVHHFRTTPHGLSPTVPGPSSRFSLYFPPLVHFAPRVLVLYYLSPAFKNPAPDLVQGRHLWPIPPLFFYVVCFLPDPSDDQACWVIICLSGPVLLSTFTRCFLLP
jgi:hypothetical protein